MRDKDFLVFYDNGTVAREYVVFEKPDEPYHYFIADRNEYNTGDGRLLKKYCKVHAKPDEEDQSFARMFKEKAETGEQFVWKDGNWVKSNEAEIDSLWNVWVVSSNAQKRRDDNGFIIYGRVR